MRKCFIAALVMIFCAVTINGQENNDFYDNTGTVSLKGPDIIVGGEVSNPGKANLEVMNKRSVIVREAFFDDKGEPSFTGAYRYDGYSLFDILKERYVDKEDREEFGPVIDLLVIVENDEGERVVLSWGEIFYPQTLHRIIIATGVSPIIPTRSRDQWPIPERTRLVCSVDMISERNISNPSRITVLTQPMSFPADRELEPLYSGRVTVHHTSGRETEITSLEEYTPSREYPSIFYGRGRGFHGIRCFRGKLMKSVLGEGMDISSENLRTGYLVVSAADGYRITMTFSELFNRNDQCDFLLIDRGEDSEGGRFLIYPAADFFSDRAVKAITDIYFKNI